MHFYSFRGNKHLQVTTMKSKAAFSITSPHFVTYRKTSRPLK